jgi:hypothetical protein
MIRGIIDNKYSEIKNDFFRVIPFDMVEDGAKILIAVEKYEFNDDIVKQIMHRHKKSTIVRFCDLYEGQ